MFYERRQLGPIPLGKKRELNPEIIHPVETNLGNQNLAAKGVRIEGGEFTLLVSLIFMNH